MKKLNKKLVIATIIALTIYLLSYELPKKLVDVNKLHYLYLPIDEKIPFHAPAIVIYVLAYIQWLVGAIVVDRQDEETGYYCYSSFIVGSLIGMFIFLIYPTAIIRPEFEVHNIFDALTKMIYGVDSIANALPSFHCFVSWTLTRVIFKYKDVSISFKIFYLIFSLLVFASTVLTKQHFFIDIPTGILLAEISLLLGKRISFKKLFELFK